MGNNKELKASNIIRVNDFRPLNSSQDAVVYFVDQIHEVLMRALHSYRFLQQITQIEKFVNMIYSTLYREKRKSLARLILDELAKAYTDGCLPLALEVI